MKERDLRKTLQIATVVSLVAAASSCTPRPSGEATPTPDRTQTFVPTATPEPSDTETPTATRTPTLTLTPTPNWEATNIANLDSRLEGESVDLINVQVDEILIVNPPGIRELVYGVIRDDENSARYIIENFDCQFRHLREEGQLGEEREGFLWRRWDISGVSFERITVTKSTELPGAGFFTSQSYQLQGESEVCPEDPILRPVTDAVREAIDWARNLVIRITEGGD